MLNKNILFCGAVDNPIQWRRSIRLYNYVYCPWLFVFVKNAISVSKLEFVDAVGILLNPSGAVVYGYTTIFIAHDCTFL